jgi:hypothetical protein
VVSRAGVGFDGARLGLRGLRLREPFIDFVATTERRFDVIVVDSTDPIGPGPAGRDGCTSR